jgi:hypothetical protein
VDPKDPEAAYWVGMIDWTEAHENTLKALQPAGLRDDGEGNVKAPKKILATIKAENAPLVDEGLRYLNQAVANRANYDDAMAYLNLIYRRKADVDYGNAAAVKATSPRPTIGAPRRWAHARPMKRRRTRGRAASPWMRVAT